MKIAFFEIEEWEIKTFNHLEQSHEVFYAEQVLNIGNASQFEAIEIASVFVNSVLDAATLKKMPNLKMIATRSTGFDHIDRDYCKNHGICVCNVPSYGENTVAEHVFALLLAISHRLVESFERTRKGNFSPKGLEGFDLQGKTLGVIGTGHIGRHVIRIAKGFEMRVLAHDLLPDPSLDVTYVDFDELLKKSDIVTLHVPGGKQNAGMLSEKEFQAMKEGVVIINTSRGDLIDIEALLRALLNKKVKAAGLDVLAEEPLLREEAELLRAGFAEEQKLKALLANHVLMNMENVVITPHNAFHTREAVQRILSTTSENILRYISGSCINTV